MVTTCMAGMSVPASADGDTSYTITIPSTLTVENSGWNSIGNISATGTLATGKKLTVSAASANSWVLKSGDNSVSYTLTTAEGGSQTTSWEFTELSNTETTKPLGIIVADYSDKPAGTYTDTVTFTAKVENAVTTRTVTWNASDITNARVSFTKDGITITARMIDDEDKNFVGPGTFTTASGKFTKIEVTAPYVDISGTGWSGSDRKKTWTGDASSSVSYSGDIYDMDMGQLKIVFTIEE